MREVLRNVGQSGCKQRSRYRSRHGIRSGLSLIIYVGEDLQMNGRTFKCRKERNRDREPYNCMGAFA